VEQCDDPEATVNFTEGQITRAKLSAHYDLYEEMFGDLYDSRLIPGRGAWHPKVAFIGETPTVMEERTGNAFASKTGTFIESMMDDFGMKHSSAFLTYFNKYYVTAGGPNDAVNIPAMSHMLRTELAILDPDVVVPMGILPVGLWFERPDPLSDMAGNVYMRRGHTVIPMFHPAQAMYDEVTREATERHFKTLADTLLGLRTPSTGKSLRRA